MYLLNKIRRLTTATSEIARKVNVTSAIPLLAISFMLSSAAATAQAQTPPKTWIEADTGHRVTRLTDEPNSEALLSGRNAFTPDGMDMIYVSPRGIHVLNLATLTTRLLVSDNDHRVHNVIVGTKTRSVFFTSLGAYVRVVDIDTGQQTIVSHSLFPPTGKFFSINADETLLVGTTTEMHAQLDFYRSEANASQEALDQLKAHHLSSYDEALQNKKERRLDAHLPEEMFTFNLQTGEVRTILKGTDWLNKVQFSPTDPGLILYKHEVPYANTEVDRIWTIRADGTQNQMIHQRTIPGEIATHEFWSRDGKTIWYEVQKPIPNQPASMDHYLVGYDVSSGKRRYFHMDQLEYSINYDSSSNDSLFCGSGQQSKPTQGSEPIDSQLQRSGEWIEVLHPILNNGDIGASMQNASSFRRERLVNIFNNRKYTTTPWFASEVRFSPDGRLVIFTSKVFGTPNGYGPTYIYAVEVN